MPRVTSSVLRIVPVLLASIAFSSTAFAACAPETGQATQQASPAAAAAPVPSAAGEQVPASEAAGQEAREVLAALGRLEDADTALSLAGSLIASASKK